MGNKPVRPISERGNRNQSASVTYRRAELIQDHVERSVYGCSEGRNVGQIAVPDHRDPQIQGDSAVRNGRNVADRSMVRGQSHLHILAWFALVTGRCCFATVPGEIGPVARGDAVRRSGQHRRAPVTESQLAETPYTLRHAAVSTWLNAGVGPPQGAEWAGHSVDVLLRVYAKCIAGEQDEAKRRILEATQPGRRGAEE